MRRAATDRGCHVEGRKDLERETGFEPATFCLGSPGLASVVAPAWKGERITDSYGVVVDAAGRWCW
jgi:hypothetical protein